MSPAILVAVLVAQGAPGGDVGPLPECSSTVACAAAVVRGTTCAKALRDLMRYDRRGIITPLEFKLWRAREIFETSAAMERSRADGEAVQREACEKKLAVRTPTVAAALIEPARGPEPEASPSLLLILGGGALGFAAGIILGVMLTN